jgi:hypothetical protein
LDPEDGGDVTPKRRFTLNGVHGIISQKKILFITTGVRTSVPTNRDKFPGASRFSEKQRVWNGVHSAS